MPMTRGPSVETSLPLQFKMNILPYIYREQNSTIILTMAEIPLMNQTIQQYDQAVRSCEDIFLKKTRDYGTSWRVLRIISIADQLFIKARRIRTLQEAESQRVDEDKAGEFRAMVNY